MKLRVTLFLLCCSIGAIAQIKISTITDESTESSKAVMSALRSKIATFPKQFTLVSNQDSDSGLLVMADCVPREQSKELTCYYTDHYVGLSGKTFMGAEIAVAPTSEDMARKLLASIAQDITERWNSIIRQNAIEALEACLFLTQSNCKVPGQLESELKTKIINLSQYLQKGGLKK